jgi:WhiB family redox-sensing transcriptional regulator
MGTGGRSRTEWRAEAACRDLDLTVFFPEPGDIGQLGRARTVCGGCPVRRSCLREGMSEGQGIWGGSTTNERNRPGRAFSSPTGAP